MLRKIVHHLSKEEYRCFRAAFPQRASFQEPLFQPCDIWFEETDADLAVAGNLAVINDEEQSFLVFGKGITTYSLSLKCIWAGVKGLPSRRA